MHTRSTWITVMVTLHDCRRTSLRASRNPLHQQMAARETVEIRGPATRVNTGYIVTARIEGKEFGIDIKFLADLTTEQERALGISHESALRHQRLYESAPRTGTQQTGTSAL